MRLPKSVYYGPTGKAKVGLVMSGVAALAYSIVGAPDATRGYKGLSIGLCFRA